MSRVECWCCGRFVTSLSMGAKVCGGCGHSLRDSTICTHYERYQPPKKPLKYIDTSFMNGRYNTILTDEYIIVELD